MSELDKIQTIMVDTFKDLADQLGQAEPFECKDEMILFGAGATLDSLTLVSLVVDLESRISDEWGREISLTDDRAMTRAVSPFDTFISLKTYINELVTEK
ncbi:MAG: hypothetical protein H0W73_14870 [Bacteroidetes bacterium]|nr:hypothetical protein [Bacteroidota bacterium]